MKLMDVIRKGNEWWITQEGWEDYGPFNTESEAYRWADSNIDDQVTGNPNAFVPELRTPKRG